MPIAATNEVGLRIVEETTFGVTPATPNLKSLRFTGESLIANKETAVSEVIRNDRQRDFLAEVGASAEGDINTEVAFGTGDIGFLGGEADILGELDIELRGVLQSEFIKSDSGDGDTVAADTMATAIPAGTHGGTITGPGSTFQTDGIKKGDTITLAGTATQDGDYRVERTVSETVIEVEAGVGSAPLAAEAGSGDETVTTPLNSIDIVAAARTFTRTAGSFVVDQFRVGQWVVTEGFTDPLNNGLFRVETVTALVLTVEAGFGGAATLVNETGDADERIFGNRITNGTTSRSYSAFKDFADITQIEALRGMRFGQVVLNVALGEIVTGAFTLTGKGDVEMAATLAALTTAVTGETDVDADSTEQMNATTNVGNLFEGGVALTTCIQSIALTVNNNTRNVGCVGSKFPQEVNLGFVDVTGTLEMSFEDAALFTKFINHTSSALVFSFTDSASNRVVVTLPRIFFGTGSPVASGGNEEVALSMEFTAIREQVVGGQSIQFDVLPAVLP